MKHLKTYENINKYKNYIIVKSDRIDIRYYILSVTGNNEDVIFYNEFAFYNENNNNKFAIRKGEDAGGEIPINDFPILYETNDFEDARKRLDFIIQNDATKYNL